jgi:CHAD domain-containing protein
VQIGYLDKAQPGDDTAALTHIRRRLQANRKQAQARLVTQLDSAELRAWIREWRTELTTSPAASSGPSTGQVARDLVLAQARKLRKRGRRISSDSTADDYHDVRIHAKRLRYLIDAFSELYGSAASDYLKALGKLQDVLGEYHDAAVRAESFRNLAKEPALAGAPSFLLGRLVGGDESAWRACRDQFPKAWRRVRRRRWRSLQAAMAACASSA